MSHSAIPAEPLAWIDTPAPDGRWGSPEELALPIGDRGLLLADGLFETLLVLGGTAQLLGAHLARWHSAAALLGMEAPPQRDRLEPLITAAVERSGIRSGALRLNWSRGTPGAGSGRGVALPDHCRHRFWLQLNPATPCFAPVTVLVSASERRDPLSLLSRCKTFAYGSAIQARRGAAAAGADDALLTSTSGELSCGSTANLLLRRGDGWLTPPLTSGCLPGVMRARALELGLAREAPLHPHDLHHCSGALLLNSLGCRPIHQLHTPGEQRAIAWPQQGNASWAAALAQEAASLWTQLL
jgi:branched-subunit amino acid aminotransferase/4-amino-4-deoxychorismate lyase